MKRLLAALCIIFSSVTSSLAGDLYGCIINESPLPVKGSVVSPQTTVKFDVKGSYVWCRMVPEGNYSVITEDGCYHDHFEASGQHSIGLAGDRKIYWIIKIREKDLK